MTTQPQGTVLYVDDDETNRHAITSVFRQAGFEVKEAATGSEALRLVEEQPDLVILDVHLPDIDGFEVCRHIKAHPATTAIPVLHMSGVFVTAEDRMHALEEGADAFLTKPVEPRELIAQARALLRTHRGEERRQDQKMEALIQLASGVAHDFTNLLSAVTRNVSLLLAEAQELGPQRDQLVAIDEAAWRAVELTQQLVEFSRGSAPRLRPTDVRACLEVVVRFVHLGADPRIRVEMRCDPALWPVQANPAQVNQALINLCLNAVDAMPNGGHLLLEAENVVRRQARQGEFVRLRVRDSGPGLPPDVQAHLFEPYFTTKGPGKGTGLGLAVVFGIVRQHRGWIEYTGAVDQGACFEIYLPRFCGATNTAVPGPDATAEPAKQEEVDRPWECRRSGLTKAEAEELLDWLESGGCRQHELGYEEDKGFVVRWSPQAVEAHGRQRGSWWQAPRGALARIWRRTGRQGD